MPYRVPRHCTVVRDGRRARIDYGENDHCTARFALVDDWLRVRGLEAEGRVGHAGAWLARARDIVAVTSERLTQNPLLFLHPASERCTECDEARRGVGA